MTLKTTDVWQTAAETIVKAGMVPIMISDALIELLQTIMTEEQARFITVFDKPSLNFDQIEERTRIDKTALKELLEELMFAGVIVGTKSKSTRMMVYRLLGPFPGIFEYTNLRGETSEKHKKLAQLFDRLLNEMSLFTQQHYDLYVKEAKNFPPITRVVPVEERIDVNGGDKIMPLEEVSRIIDKFDDIALAHCYCRHSKDLLDDPCQTTDERLNCLLLGKSAQFAASYAFGHLIDKAEAKRILTKASDEGLVHKAFHIHLNTDLDEEAICNCCKCCCGPFQMYHRGVAPYHCYTNFLAEVNLDHCTACEDCLDLCPLETIEMEAGELTIKAEKCIGCGICAHHCPEGAILLGRTETRQVFVPPKRIPA